MDSLKAVLCEAMAGYAVGGYNARNYFLCNEQENIYTIITLGKFLKEHIADAALIARIHHDLIIIEQDINDKPLVDALIQAGIPREQIILAYAGEPIPESADIF